MVDLRLATGQVRSSGNADAAGVGIDTLISIETIAGSSFDDVMTGNADANRLLGSAGNDLLSGGEGNDVLSGGSGDDILDGGGGSDAASYVGGSSGVRVSLAIAGAQNTGEGMDTLTAIENLDGSLHDDVLT